MIKKLLELMKKDTRIETLVFGVLSSIIASALWSFSPTIFKFLGNYTFGAFLGLINSSYIRAATLEAPNFSFFIIVILFMLLSIGWLEVSRVLKQVIAGKTQEVTVKQSKGIDQAPIYAKMFVRSFILVVHFVFAWFLLIIVSEITTLNAITDFKQHIRIITPYVTVKEKQLIISRWSRMRSFQDYEGIYSDLKEIAKKNSITLYRNKLY